MEKLYYLFSEYYHSILKDTIIRTPNSKVIELLNKKFIHTFRVVQNAREICIRENFPDRVCIMAEIAALFHDIGRFKQAVEYSSFNDKETFNHAAVSAGIFNSLKYDILKVIDEKEFSIVKNSILYHNVLSLPKHLTEDEIEISNILRDADKLNILSINIKSGFIKGDGSLPYDEVINDKCLESLLSKQVVNVQDIYTNIDDNIKMLSWMYDLNYKASLDMYLEEGYIDILTDTTNIASSEIINQLNDIKHILTRYINNK